jgi:hypothetical protein
LSRPVIQAITNVQFFQQLATVDAITQAEALAAVGRGAIPAALQRVVDASANKRNSLRQICISLARQRQRNHPLTDAIGALPGMAAARVDDLFIAAAAL